MYSKLLGEQGQCSSESTPPDPPMWLWFEFQRQPHLWVEFAVGSLPCSINFFAVHLDFSLSHKPIFPNSTTIRIVDEESLHVWMCFAYFFLSFLIL